MFLLILTPDVWGQEDETLAAPQNSKTASGDDETAWINDAIEMLEFIEENELILRETSYDEYDQLVLNAPSEEKLNRLYELLIDAMFVGSADVTAKYMPLYVAEIERSGSTELIVSSMKGKNGPFGVEALVRAQTRTGDVIPPESFISHAVSTGKVSLFTKLSLLKSIRMLEDSDLECPLLFNLSREQITDPNVLDIVTGVLEATDFPANRLIIELSERTLNQDLSVASETLKDFRRRGVRIALDDFGSANTGFSSLLDFEFDLIKTDRNLLCSAMEFPRTKHLLSNLVDLSQKLNVLCVIEGIETPAEVSFVKNLGGEILQGYIFGRPEETPKYRSHLHRMTDPETENTVLDLDRQKKLA